MSKFPIYLGEDNPIEWDEMRDGHTGNYVNDASVSFNLKDKDGNSISTGVLSYIASSNGRYQGTIDKADIASVTDLQLLYLELTAVSGTKDGFRRIPSQAQYHEVTP